MPVRMPEGKRVAVNIGVDFDAHSAWIGTMGKTSPSYLSRGEFDAEVALPRLLSALARHDVTGNFFTPGHTMETYPDAFATVLDSGHEISAHGCWHEPLLSLSPDEERRLMEVQLAQHEMHVGTRPRGYRSPAWDFTDTTLTLLDEFGFDWDSSLMGRDFHPYRPRPVTVGRETGDSFGPASNVLEFPVSWYLDDFPAVEYIPGVNNGLQDPQVIFARWKDHFDFARERVPNGLVTITVHPQSIGRAHMILMFERLLEYMAQFDDVWFTSLSAIFDAYSD